jgi:hypothetical protein
MFLIVRCILLPECVTVASEEGQYFFKGDTGGEVCGLYLLTDPDRRVQLNLDYLDIPCATGGLVSVSRSQFRDSKSWRDFTDFRD